jgi:ribosomal protein S27E
MACPSCGLDFKVDATEDVVDDLLARGVGQVLRESGLDSGDEREEVASRRCPYCAHVSTPQDFIHPDAMAYLKATVLREYVEPMFSRMLDRTFGSIESNAFFKVTYTRGARSSRQLTGPEPTDMVRIRCVQCETLFKVADSWKGTLYCSGCGTELLAQ